MNRSKIFVKIYNPGKYNELFGNTVYINTCWDEFDEENINKTVINRYNKGVCDDNDNARINKYNVINNCDDGNNTLIHNYINEFSDWDKLKEKKNLTVKDVYEYIHKTIYYIYLMGVTHFI